MYFELGEWRLHPFHVYEDDKFIAEYGNKKAFVKKNTTDALSLIAQQKLAPKVIWVKTDIRGDVFSAQEFIDGRILTASDMTSNEINKILSELRSKHLVDALKRKFGLEVRGPEQLLAALLHDNKDFLLPNDFLMSIIEDMNQNIPSFDKSSLALVHGHVSADNWLKSKLGTLYLVDWDDLYLGDPLVDSSYILSHYISRANWETWLSYSGFRMKEDNLQKVIWYGKLAYLKEVCDAYDPRDFTQVNQRIAALRKFCDQVK